MRIILFLIGFLFSSTLFADAFNPPQTITATNTSTRVLAINAKRSYLLIQNIGTVGVYVSTQTQVGTVGVYVPAGGAYEPVAAPINEIWVVSESGNNNIVVMQGTP